MQQYQDKDAMVKVETKLVSAKDVVAEVTYATGPATVGIKYSGGACDIGCRMMQGPLFGSLLTTGNLKIFTGHLYYKVNDKLKVACTGIYGGKASGSFTVGCAYDVSNVTKAKAKVSKDGVVSCSVKHDISKGFTATLGGKYNTVKGDPSFGLSLSVE